ncbi:hypothetical protein AB0K89_21100 [Streptomyces cinnamoneus]|uniref:hypothetical protein n=1 Tax=Streptomyces cinnamoneus TaxID=53446 RepID=UPI00341ECB7D
MQENRGREDGGRKTAVIAVVLAGVVVVAAGVTGYVVLSGDGKKDEAGPGTAASASSRPVEPSPSGNGRGGDGDPKPVVPGWKVVVNPQRGIAFDVPPEWDRKSVDWASYVAEQDDPDDKAIIGFKAPAMLKEEWCRTGNDSTTPLAAAGSRSEIGARNTDDAARRNAGLWIYGAYTQPDKKKIKTSPAKPFTTGSGLTGSMATSYSAGPEKTGTCDYNGKATAFVFKDAHGDFASWSFHGVKGVAEEVPDATVRKILYTVRVYRE